MPDEWSISDGYFDVEGVWHATSAATRTSLRAAMGKPGAGPPMWFVEVERLRAGAVETLAGPCVIELDDGRVIPEVSALPADLPIGYHDLVPVDGGPVIRLVVHPHRCQDIPDEWGLSTQIYALWSERSWGIGDLGDLAVLSRSLAAAGGSAILVSPLHQPAPSLPQEASPYFPSSRRAWNPLLLAMDPPVPTALVCTPEALIDRDTVWPLKREALEALFAQSTAPAQVPNTIALWNALCDELGAEWREWPQRWRRFDPSALATRMSEDAGFAQRATFHQWCQSLLAAQLAAVAEAGVTIIGDLAVGFSPGGADAWEYQDLLALDVRVGAPPDTFSEAGQEWGIPPFIPWRVRNALYQPYIDTIRAALRGVHGLRMDHVMWLFRQFWIPEGAVPADGAYVTFPAHELLAIICIEATRAGAYVVGEDLGTVEPGVRQRLAEHNIAGTRVLWFEDEPPRAWPVGCLATVTTHDLPTIAGVFNGTDGEKEKRVRLADLVSAGSVADVVAGVHEALLASPARLRLLATDDVCVAPDRANLPGTVGGANWRRRLPLPVDAIAMPTRLR